MTGSKLGNRAAYVCGARVADLAVLNAGAQYVESKRCKQKLKAQQLKEFHHMLVS